MTLRFWMWFDRKLPLYQIYGCLRTIMQKVFFGENLYLFCAVPQCIAGYRASAIFSLYYDLYLIGALDDFRQKWCNEVLAPKSVSSSSPCHTHKKCPISLWLWFSSLCPPFAAKPLPFWSLQIIHWAQGSKA